MRAGQRLAGQRRVRCPCRGRCRRARRRSTARPRCGHTSSACRVSGSSCRLGLARAGRRRRRRAPRRCCRCCTAAGGVGLRARGRVVVADGARDVGQVARAVARDDAAEPGRRLAGHARQHALADLEALVGEQALEVLVERGDAVVVEAGGAGAEDRHVLPRLPERLAVAHDLAGDVAPGVVGAAPLELVDRDDVGEVEHVDLLELAGGAVLRRHDVEADVAVLDDAGVALADAGRLDDDEVVAGGLAGQDRVRQAGRHLAAGAAGGQRPEEDARRVGRVEGVHPDAVAEQRAAAAPAGRVDGEDGDAELVLVVQAQPAQQLVGQRALARAAGAGDAEDRDGAARGDERGGQLLTGLELGDQPGERRGVALRDGLQATRAARRGRRRTRRPAR